MLCLLCCGATIGANPWPQVLSSVAAQLGPRFLMFESMADTYLEEAGAEEQAKRCAINTHRRAFRCMLGVLQINV